VEGRGDLNKRSWPAITVDILETTLSPANKMRVMYRSNLNFERFSRYFYDLLRKGFIEEMNNGNGRTVYKITDRGKTLLGVLKTAEQLVSEEEVPV
jgi:predicted transcriptional regulator